MQRSSTLSVNDDGGYDAASYQHLGIDGYYPYPVVASFEQVGEYRLPLASVSKKNNPGMLRKDGVGDLDSRPNNYMPQWSAPSNGRSVNQTGGMAQNPMGSYQAGQQQANAFSANADETSAIGHFVGSLSPRYAGLSALSGE